MASLTLTNRILKAQNILSASFGVDKKDYKEVYKYLLSDSLKEVYEIDSSRKEVYDQFLSMSKTVKQMRSSFFPVDFLLSTENYQQSDKLIKEIQDQVSPREPYENTFLRMLGLPIISWDQNVTSEEIHRIPPDTELLVLDPISKELTPMSLQLIKINIFDERKVSRDERRFIINNRIYNVPDGPVTVTLTIPDTLSVEFLSLQEKAKLFSLRYEVVESEVGGPNIEVVVNPYDNNRDVTEEVRRVASISRGTPATGTDGDQLTGFINPINYQFEISPAELARAPLLESNPETREANVTEVTKDLYKFCYMLFPPIQDPDISGTINETDKIVAPLFSGDILKKVNSNTLKPSLLESIIRIRLDKISGRTSPYTSAENMVSTVDSAEQSADDYGILEALFIVRLKSAISGLASKMIYEVETLLSEIDKSRRKPADPGSNPSPDDNRSVGVSRVQFVLGKENIETVPNDEEEANPAEQTQVTGEGMAEEDSDGETPTEREELELADETLVVLQNQKLIEDAILFFLQDNKDILDLQAQTQRSASIYNSHMMSGLLNIVDVPRKRIEEEIAKIKDSRDEQASSIINELADNISTILGVDTGIGTLDVAVFCLALFTISEDSLLGLLTEAQFERIKNGEFKSLIPADQEKKDVVESLDELTELLFEGYQLFKDNLMDTDSELPDQDESQQES